MENPLAHTTHLLVLYPGEAQPNWAEILEDYMFRIWQQGIKDPHRKKIMPLLNQAVLLYAVL